MSATTSADGICQTSRMLPFAPPAVFAAFANAERLAEWWGPDGFTNTFEVFEFRSQGRWKFVMHAPDGRDYPNESQFLEVSPLKIVIRHCNAPLFTLTVSLRKQGEQTEVHWHQAFDDPRVASSLAHIVVPANEQNLNRLQASLARARP